MFGHYYCAITIFPVDSARANHEGILFVYLLIIYCEWNQGLEAFDYLTSIISIDKDILKR